MKLILAIVPQKEAMDVMNGLVGAHFNVTRFASTGGFLRRGNVTLLVGTENEKVDEALALIKRLAGSRGAGAHSEGTALVMNVARMVRVDAGSGQTTPAT